MSDSDAGSAGAQGGSRFMDLGIPLICSNSAQVNASLCLPLFGSPSPAPLITATLDAPGGPLRQAVLRKEHCSEGACEGNCVSSRRITRGALGVPQALAFRPDASRALLCCRPSVLRPTLTRR